MTVAELITMLHAMPQDGEVCVYEGEGDYWDALHTLEIDPESKRVFLYGDYAIALRKGGDQ